MADWQLISFIEMKLSGVRAQKQALTQNKSAMEINWILLSALEWDEKMYEAVLKELRD